MREHLMTCPFLLYKIFILSAKEAELYFESDADRVCNLASDPNGIVLNWLRTVGQKEIQRIFVGGYGYLVEERNREEFS